MDLELAWAAGFFDGEGCSCIQRRQGGKYLGIALQISQCNIENLERFLAAVDQGTIRGPYIGRNPNSNPSWRWRVGNAEGVHEVMKQLWPYLGSIKKKQYLRVRAEVKAA